MKRRKIFFMIFTGVMLMMVLSGCGEQKYKLNLDGYGLETEKTEYAPGEEVTVYFKVMVTDTRFDFYLDDESIELKQTYDREDRRVLSFFMPDHDVTLKMDFYNMMEYIPQVNVTFVNEAEEADIWILPRTEDNMKTAVWGKATIGKLPVGEKREIFLRESGETEKWIIKIISGNRHYSVSDISLHEEDTIFFRSETKDENGIRHKVESIEILDRDGNSVYKNEDIFVGSFGEE